MLRTLSLAMLVAATSGTMTLAQQGPPGDCDVRTYKDAFTNDTVTTLTLMLQGPKGPLPINMAITVRHKARPQGGPPDVVQLEFDLPLFVGQLDFRPPHLLMTLDKGTDDERVATLAVESTAPMYSVTHADVPCDADTLRTMAKAKTIDGLFFGQAFALTPKQARALSDFVGRQLR